MVPLFSSHLICCSVWFRAYSQGQNNPIKKPLTWPHWVQSVAPGFFPSLHSEKFLSLQDVLRLHTQIGPALPNKHCLPAFRSAAAFYMEQWPVWQGASPLSLVNGRGYEVDFMDSSLWPLLLEKKIIVRHLEWNTFSLHSIEHSKVEHYREVLAQCLILS